METASPGRSARRSSPRLTPPCRRTTAPAACTPAGSHPPPAGRPGFPPPGYPPRPPVRPPLLHAPPQVVELGGQVADDRLACPGFDGEAAGHQSLPQINRRAGG